MAADFGNLLNNEMDGYNIQKSSMNKMPIDSSSKDNKLNTLKQIQKLQTKQIDTGNLSISDVKELTQILGSRKVPEFRPMIASMILNLKNTILDAVMTDLLTILDTELGGDVGYDFSFLTQLVTRLDTLAKESINPEYSKALQNILSKNSNLVTDTVLKSKIQEVLQGINQLDATQSLEVSNIPKDKMNITDIPKSSNVDILGASNKMNIPGLDGVDDMVFDEKTNSVSNKSKTIKVEQTQQNSVMADIALQSDEKIVGHAKAFGTLNNMDIAREMNPFISAIIQIANIQPLFVISSVVSKRVTS